MLKEAIGTGATVDLAKADAIAQLGISADSDFEIEVLEMPTKKMFGLLGTTPAKVKVSYDAPSEAGAKEYLEKILASLGIEGAEIKIEETDEEVSISSALSSTEARTSREESRSTSATTARSARQPCAHSLRRAPQRSESTAEMLCLIP